MLATVTTVLAQNEWQRRVKDELPQMGHRN